MELDRSIIIDIPSTRVCKKSLSILIKKKTEKNILKEIKKTSLEQSYEMCVKRYSVNKRPITSNSFQRYDLIMCCSKYLKKQEYNKNKERINMKITERYKHKKIALQNKTSEETQVLRALTDLDNQFFQCVNGRPINDRVPLCKSLKLIVNSIIRLKQEIGYRHDAILKIDTNYKKELETYKKSVGKCREQSKNFEEFISEDYMKSMGFLNNWDKLKSKLEEKKSELYILANEQFTIMSKLMGLDYLYSVQQKYGRFLYYLSPPTWRSKNREFARSIEIEAKGFDLGQSSEEETFKVVFKKMQQECSDKLVQPVLYFTYPHELMNIFDSIEKQQLYNFSHVTHLAPHQKVLKEGIKSFKDIINQDSALVANTIREFQKVLDFSDERCTQLKTRFFTILNGLFYASVGAPEVLKLFVHLEFCYERVYTEKPINMDIMSLAKGLEDFYMDYTKRLDEIHNDNVKRAVAQCIQSDRKKIIRANNAAKELRLFHRLEKELHRDYLPIGERFKLRAPPLPKFVKINADTSMKRNVSKSILCKKHEENKPLDDSEMEYLRLFTDWVEGENPNKYMHRLEDNEDISN